MIKRKIPVLLTLLLALSMIFSACTVKETSDGTDKSTSTTAPTATSEQVAKTPDKMRIFYVTSGAAVPEDFDFANNAILNKITEMANVEITEAVVPPWTDITTKYNLMMSSGNICDVVHFNGPNTIINDGKNGAFIDLKEVIKKSPIITEYYAPYIEQLKADDDKIYCLRTLPVDGDVNDAFFFRWDVLKDLGYTEIPKTLDEWLDAMRKLKAKYPDSIPYTSMDNLHWCEFVFCSYGITGRGNGWQHYKGKIIHSFENPLYKDALKTYKLMLEEGLMDPEFVTNKRQDFDDKRYNKKVLVNQQNLAMCMVFSSRFMNKGIAEARPVPGQWPIVDDPRIDPEALYEGPLPLGNGVVAIASTSKVKDAAIRFVEALLSDETLVMTTWGIENVDYKIVNGEKVEIKDESIKETPAKSLYSMLFGFNTKVNIERIFKTCLNDITEANKENPDITDEKLEKELEAYKDLCWKQFDKVYADAQSVPTRTINKFIILDPDTASRQLEAQNEALTIMVKAMRGDITLEEFDNQAAKFLEKYKFITDEYNEKLPEANKKAGR